MATTWYYIGTDENWANRFNWNSQPDGSGIQYQSGWPWSGDPTTGDENLEWGTVAGVSGNITAPVFLLGRGTFDGSTSPDYPNNYITFSPTGSYTNCNFVNFGNAWVDGDNWTGCTFTAPIITINTGG